MSALAAPPGRSRLPDAAGERRLDEVIDRVWERLMAHSAARCPVCGGQMRPQYGAGARPISGRCRECRSVLS